MLNSLAVTTEIEIELTNRCNANCYACPREDMPQFGLMTKATLDRILGLYNAAYTEPSFASWIARRVTLAGGGDPLLHPRAPEFIEHISRSGFEVHLITNAAAATEARVEQLVSSGLASIAVSFWGIQPKEYERSMHLPFAKTLRKVERLAARAREKHIPLIVTWVRVPTVLSTDESIVDFWTERGIDVNVSDNEMWNRGGLLSVGPTTQTSTLLFPDPSRAIWCADLALSDAWSWDGNCVMCCCNYFTSSRLVLGNVERDGYTTLKQRKRDLLSTRPLPDMCQRCLQPRRKQASWLGEPIRSQLSADEWNVLTYRTREVVK